jgi:isopentenyl diphosphate isomerase/L-lactate dehydrogenase-like FMN-dependent dehydrogenase
VLKGIQTGEDAVMAAQSGASAVILSNHGGRNCDTSRSGIEVLPEVIEQLKEEGLRDKVEVWIDGGVRRGTDIFKVRFVCWMSDVRMFACSHVRMFACSHVRMFAWVQ